MNSLAANPTGRRPAIAAPCRPPSRCAFVEDLNWPMPSPSPGRRAPRPVEMWVPGPNGTWDGVTPTLQ